ncbi:MAG: hypothetical protein HY810_06550 [Candidatus Omnitrophica bacterium]|nr:hypothetical protein [Candidatus Omnitrophota bacterium]
MTESLLRKTIVLFLSTTIICFLWAIGSSSRKKVELVKSSELYKKLDDFTKANTVIINDLKNANNQVAALKKSHNAMKESLAQAEKEKESLQEKLKIAQQQYDKNNQELFALKNELTHIKKANSVIGDELISLKEKNLNLLEEIKKLNRELIKFRAKSPQKKTSQNSQKDEQKNQLTPNKNFAR